VGILGVTFKENVRDTRNSRVPDIAYELAEFGVQTLIHDPLADPDVVREEYGLELSPFSELDGLHGLIIAVGHSDIRAGGAAPLVERVLPGGVFVDLKSIFSADMVPTNLSYWSL
jgi:UDP-N-acetyl-D-galactosamine dehydrogenase